MKRPTIDSLHAECIDTKPLDMDWRSQPADFEGYNDGEHGWQYWEAEDCDKCGAVVVLNGGGDESHKDFDGTDCDGWIGLSEGPMMNYWYPFGKELRDLEPLDVAKQLAHVPLCLVQVNGNYGLALTGGGMDLSWEICEAFMLIGQLPPTHFSRLPSMSGRGNNARDKWIIAGCRKAIEVKQNWLRNDLDGLDSMVKWARKERKR